MNNETDINDKLAAIAAIGNQKARTDAYLELLETLLSPPSAPALIAFGRHFVSSSAVAMVVGRRVLGDFVSALCGGSDLQKKQSGEDVEEEAKWAKIGQEVFGTEEGKDIRQEVVEGVLTPGGLAGWCEEQTTVLRHLQAGLLEAQDEWLGAARALAQIPLEGGSRTIPDEEKLAIYIKIVRLMLECGENGQAQTYQSRASLLKSNDSPKETRLQFDLCQARLYDYDCRFFEAAQSYHTISFETSVDESDRLQMLKSAVITCILAPAGPNRTRVLAALNKDDRVQSSLPPFMSTMLTKTFHEYIVRPAELEEFEASLEQHQRATGASGDSILQRAIRDHNVGACGKVYDNIGLEALGALLGLDPEAAEATACKMIGQGRLRAWVDQPTRCLYFESRSTTDQAEAKGSAGGLHIEEKEIDIEPITWTERWDNRIRYTSLQVESVSAAIQARNLLPALQER